MMTSGNVRGPSANSPDSLTAGPSPSHRDARRPNMPLFLGIMGAALVIAGLELIVFPNLLGNPRYLALALATPLLGGLSFAITRSGLRQRLPGQTANVVRGTLALVVLLDLVIFLLPMFVSGATAHDTAPRFVASNATGAVPTAPTSAASATATTAGALVRMGQFDHRPGGDTVSGTAILGKTADGSMVLRLQHLQATNGPDLYVYLAKVESPATNQQVMSGLEVGRLKATSGDQNYTLGASVDLSQYQSVVIYCKSFSVIFGFANLA